MSISKLFVVFLLHPVGVGATRAMNVFSAKLRVLRDALACAGSCHGAVAAGGEFSRGTAGEWDLTRPPMPSILTCETFAETRTISFKQAVTQAFQRVIVRAAA